VDYGAVARKVKAGLAKAGTVMSLRQTSVGTYNPTTGEISGGVVVDSQVIGLMITQSLQTSGAGERFFAGTQVLAQDKFVTLEALAATPRTGDQLIIGGTVYNIVVVVPVEPGGVSLMYKVMVRK
jgi:hypothetical protein